jgi:predicted RecB family endonuclease
MEKDDALHSIETFVKKIQSYIKRLEMQIVKLAEVLFENDPENSEQLQAIAEEDTDLISEASDLQFRFASLREKIMSEKKSNVHAPSPDYKEMIDM